jgi:hypothetical protein
MDTQIDSAQLFKHFGFGLTDIYDSAYDYKTIVTKLGTKFSARELCEALIENFWFSESIPEESRDCDANCLTSSVFAVACEFTNKLQSQYMLEYAQDRGGPFAQSNRNVISLRQIIKWMISQ